MASNIFGRIFTFTTFGESHGVAIGCVIDGVPSLMPLTGEDIQVFLNKRRPGVSKYTSPRKESDTVKILSGVFEGLTTGTPIGLLIENADQRSKDYDDIASSFRPAHADFTYYKKYGIRDHRGGGRASARETAMRVAAGAVARKVIDRLAPNPIDITASLVQIGDKRIDYDKYNPLDIDKNEFFTADISVVDEWGKYIEEIISAGSSIGGMVEIRVNGLPVGLGAPIYAKIDQDLAAALMGVNAVKGVEIGDGFKVASMRGEENADEIVPDSGSPSGVSFLSNHAGGVLGGITTGQELVVRAAIKPTSSISIPRQSVDLHGRPVTVVTKGRHDPCIAIRAVPVLEAMVACVIADHLLLSKASDINNRI